MKTYIFKTQLLHAKRVQRDIEAPEDFSLYKLAEGIVAAYDFDFDHPFGFFNTITEGWGLSESKKRYEPFADLGPKEAEGAKSVKKTKINVVWKKLGDAMMFLFDYGDDWRWIVTLTGFTKRDSKKKYPCILKKDGEAPEQYPEVEE